MMYFYSRLLEPPPGDSGKQVTQKWRQKTPEKPSLSCIPYPGRPTLVPVQLHSAPHLQHTSLLLPCPHLSNALASFAASASFSFEHSGVETLQPVGSWDQLKEWGEGSQDNTSIRFSSNITVGLCPQILIFLSVLPPHTYLNSSLENSSATTRSSNHRTSSSCHYVINTKSPSVIKLLVLGALWNNSFPKHVYLYNCSLCFTHYNNDALCLVTLIPTILLPPCPSFALNSHSSLSDYSWE